MNELLSFILKVLYYIFWIGLNSIYIGYAISMLGSDVSPILNGLYTALLAVSLVTIGISSYGLLLTVRKA